MSPSRGYGLVAGLFGVLFALASVTLPIAAPVSADDDDENEHNGGNRNNRDLRADPFVFVGDRGDCGPNYPAGSNIVTAGWLGGMGLPDNGGQNVGSNPQDNPNKNDAHLGLLLNKNGTTPDCSSSGATIRGAEGMVTSATTQLGYDFRNGGHCGAGAPRFNLTVQPPTGPESFHFVGGCANSAQTPSTQDPAQWTQARALLTNPAQTFPVVPPGSRIKSLTIIYDEGTDTTSLQDPNGVGLAVVDNIFVDGKTIRSGNGVATNRVRGRDDDENHRPKKHD